MAISRLRSLKRLLLMYELALLLLVVITGALGGLWAYFWQQTSAESVRLNDLTYAAQGIRSDLFRQIKEVTLGRLMEDPEALNIHSRYSRRIDGYFNAMRRNTNSRAEEYAIQELQQAYRIIQKDMNKIFTDPYMINRVVRLQILDPAYEQAMVGGFEAAFDALEHMIRQQHTQLERTIDRWTYLAPLMIPVPILLAIALLLFSRRSLQQGFVRPVASVMEGARLITEGKLDHQISQEGAEEMVNIAFAINHMAAELAHSRDALVEKEKQAALGGLVPVVAHNIRNPLASIRASAQLLDHADTPAEVREIKQAVIGAVDRLGRWVSALVSYLHPLKPSLLEQAPGIIMEAALKLLELKINQKHIRVVRRPWDDATAVLVDSDLMEQAIYGLLSNAIDASPQDGQLAVGIRRTRTELLLTIEDQGPGLPFDPQPSGLSPGPSTKRLGTGLGIPVAFKICKAHGWKLEFQAPTHGGTRAVIAIPLHNLEETEH